MVKVNKNSQRYCRVCSTSFKAHSQFVKHCFDAGHESKQCCKHCIRWFCSTEALSQHNEAKHRNLPAVMPPQNQVLTVSAPQPPRHFHFQNQNCRRSPLLDMAAIHNRLILNCHSSGRLKKEGYLLGKENYTNGRQAALIKEMRMAPYPDLLEPKRKAVTLHCEMAWVTNGDNEIISICVIDFFTGEVLVDFLVEPQKPIVAWRTNIHGIGSATLSTAASQGLLLDGWKSARQQLFLHINTETVMVGHFLQHDLKWLRVSHVRIFDTAIVTAEAVSGTDVDFGPRRSLQSLCEDLLNLRAPGGLEDAMAAREVALWCICYPGKLKQWAMRARKKSNIERAKQLDRGRNGRGKGYYEIEGDVAVPPLKEAGNWIWPTGY